MPLNFNQKAARARNTAGSFLLIAKLARVLVGILFLAMLHHPTPASATTVTDPYSLTLAWDASPNAEIVGYHLYYGAASGNYTDSIVISNVTSVAISGLSVGVTYYFAITAIGTDGQESGFSGEISYLQAFPGAQMQIQAMDSGQFLLTVAGMTGHTYDIEATEDFSAWTVIGTVTLDASGTTNFTDADAPNFPQRFYRTHDTQP
jgi:hypothetical protein